MNILQALKIIRVNPIVSDFDGALGLLKRQGEAAAVDRGPETILIAITAALTAYVSTKKLGKAATAMEAPQSSLFDMSFPTTSETTEAESPWVPPIITSDVYTIPEQVKEVAEAKGLSTTFNPSKASRFYQEKFADYINKYFPQHGVPTAMGAIRMIETTNGSRLTSSVGAQGPWQFMPATGREYGLQKFPDDWNDPDKSTLAAAKFMKRLYGMLHNWFLVVMAYNCGAGNPDTGKGVRGAMKRAGVEVDKPYYSMSEVWTIWKEVPKETKGYLINFINACKALGYDITQFNQDGMIESMDSLTKGDKSHDKYAVSTQYFSTGMNRQG